MIITISKGKVLEKQTLLDFFSTAEWVFEIREYKKKRTNEQNSYLHALFQSFADDTGTDLEYVKQKLKKKFLTVHIYTDPHQLDTSKLNRADFNTFVDKCLDYMALLFNHRYPTPDQWKQGIRNVK